MTEVTIADTCLRDLYQKLVGVIDAHRAADPELLPWQDLENETLVGMLSEVSSGLTTVQLHRLYAKIALLKKLKFPDPGFTPLVEAVEDPLVVPYLVELVNNQDGLFADPEFLPHVTVMELAWFVYELSYLLDLTDKDWLQSCPREFKAVCGYYLSEEGLSTPLKQFFFLSQEDLLRFKYEGHASEETPEVYLARQKAVDVYVEFMKRSLCHVHN